MPYKKTCQVLLLSLMFSLRAQAQNFTFPIVTARSKVTIVYDKNAPALDSIAAHLLANDIKQISGYKPKVLSDFKSAEGNVIILGSVVSRLIQQFGSKSPILNRLKGQWECFGYAVVNKPYAKIAKALIIAGSDTRGTAYGVFTLSEKLGISPWYWWADVPVRNQKELSIQVPDFVSAPPAVKYRGIFINDEDWGLQPWAAKTFEPETGDIGPKTYAKVFELLLRLKANLIWPAMHPSTKAFFYYPGNVTTMRQYEIVIGSSHAEPMLRNNVGEWDEKTMGHFNYLTNKERVYQYWEERIRESKGVNAIYSMGMRGIHDGKMEGVKDLKDAVPVIEKIIRDERGLLTKYIDKDATRIPQALTLYKEVLQVYDYGLEVPEDITLVWPDDNYGYIQRLNNETERARKGGAGVYYHASYWGRPHDYLWLPSVHPSLMREEMMKAYETGAKTLWVVNVGDIKPQEYNLQEFLDMAWNPAPFKNSKYTRQHLSNWLKELFGKTKGNEISEILWEYYNLAFERRPEFMGWSQTEPETKTKYTEFNHFYYGDEAQRRIDRYNAIEAAVKNLRNNIDPENASAFYQLVYYPVVGASWMNKKFLYRDKAYLYGKQNRLSAHDFAQFSQAAYDSIVKETAYFNSVLANGKWNYIMAMNPRNLAVYQAPELPEISIDETNNWSIAPEGYNNMDSTSVDRTDSMALPAFDDVNRQKYFIDVYLSKGQRLIWTAVTSHDWIQLSSERGQLDVGIGEKQTRIWVEINWKKFRGNEKTHGNILFAAGGKKIVLNIAATKISKHGILPFGGFFERDGYVSIYASDFSRRTQSPTFQWQILSDFGYTGKVLQAGPITIHQKALTDTTAIKQAAPCAEYDFYTLTSAVANVSIFAIPTHPINNEFNVRYAVAVDDGPLQITDMKTFGRSDEWKQNVLRNRAERKIILPYLAAGKHTLKIYAVDAGVMLDEIRIDLRGVPAAYSVIPESIILKPGQ